MRYIIYIILIVFMTSCIQKTDTYIYDSIVLQVNPSNVFIFDTPKNYEIQTLKGNVKVVKLFTYRGGIEASLKEYIFDGVQNLLEEISNNSKMLYTYKKDGYDTNFSRIDANGDEILQASIEHRFLYAENNMKINIKFQDEDYESPDLDDSSQYTVLYEVVGADIKMSSSKDELEEIYKINENGFIVNIKASDSSDILSSGSLILDEYGRITTYEGVVYKILDEDKQGNWTKRSYYDDFFEEEVIEIRNIEYYN